MGKKEKIHTEIAVIGSGITGCCIARDLTKYDRKVTVIEKEADVGWATTKANSAIIHPGYAGTEGTLRLELSHKGNVLFREKAQELDIPLINTGSLLNIYKPHQIEELERLVLVGKKKGLTGLKIIRDRNRLKRLEPNLSAKVDAALFSPETCITSPYEAAIALFENASKNGARFLFNSEIVDISQDDAEGRFILCSSAYDIYTDVVINAAGVNSDKVSRMIGDESFGIKPIKGEYILFDPEVSDYVNRVNYRFSEGRSKGMLVTPTTGGNFFVGPNYQFTSEDDIYVTDEGLEEVKKAIADIFESVPYQKVITTFTGIRAASTTDDFVLGPSKQNRNFIQASGIQSPGLTCAFSISEVIIDSLLDLKLLHKKNKDFIPERKRFKKFNKNVIEQNRILFEEDNDYGEIICRCEKVSKAEILDAIRKGARTLDGIKFRTRAGMGRCQGGYCSLKIMKILSEQLGVPFTEITKSGGSSRIAYKKMD